jgi:hypothetical protein
MSSIPIITKKIGSRELRRMFNDPVFQEDLVKRHCQTAEIYCELAPPDANQVPGTVSHIQDWYEYNEETDKTRLLATVHFYKSPDGTIGASGKIDPQLLVVGHQIFTDP